MGEGVLKQYRESDQYWDDCLAVVRTSPLRSALFDATEWLAKHFPTYGQVAIDNSVEYTVIKAQPIINEIVTNAVIIFNEWGDEPQPDTVFEAYCESEAIWDAYEWFLDYSPLNKMRSRILGWIGTTYSATRIGKWASLLGVEHYLVGLDGLIKSIIEHALDAYNDTQVVL